MGHWLRLAMAVVVALVVHVWFFFPSLWRSGAPTGGEGLKPDMPRLHTAAVVSTAELAAKRAPQEPAEGMTGVSAAPPPGPQRLATDQPEPQEPGERDGSAQASPPSRPDSPAAAPAPAVNLPADVPAGGTVAVGSPAAAEAADRRRLDAEASRAAEALSKEVKAVLRTDWSEDRYKQFLRELDVGRMLGKPAPQLVFAYRDVGEILEVMQYYQMRLVALDVNRPRTVVEVTGLGTESVAFQRIDDFNWQAFSNRVTPRTEPFFEQLRRQVLSQALLPATPEQVRLVGITPNVPDAYFTCKQYEALKRESLELSAVATTLGRFHKTPFGAWVLAIERLQLKDGRMLEVQDSELQLLEGRRA